MIVNRLPGELELIDQVEHGRVAGILAEAWGNTRFTAPSPVPAVSLAAAKHDEGWRAIDGALLFDELEKRPLHFLDIDVESHIPLYRAGVERVSMLDAYAGLLVGMHWSGIYRGRWQRPGAGSRLARTEETRRLQSEVVRAEEERWIGVREQVWTEQEPRAVFETRLWHHFELLQVWDLLSLFLCVVPDQPSPLEPVVPWGPQLSGIDHRSETVRLPTIGRTPGGERLDLVARVVGEGRISLDPFPFAAPVTVEVEVQVLPDRGWTQAEAIDHLRRGSRRTKRWQVVPPVA
ncbi:DUF3891 family protein [Nocardioides marmotae]|uniref:DUF3891 family protein n=1 Tax=Nocardioides marmotae TaxID=2663857 RepID=A0A6I3J9J6_9ACTN|nr:DUF3891 family protein [Nocardioides marmotae]MCR6030512.1 DUF3891 family protein [Gordonia jinghuaiqii]MBC9734643.1 DUF3891 family protein [Nocardioides marmotae]MTB85745.1 DUF3891 family protein [Nocardioides marmotae]MTB94148.1 DUF3891 family protein [Nocardioides marmotae]QKE00444.1 DUF3891 family protein [Nocardioides marmotae]